MYFRDGGRDDRERYAFSFLTAYQFLELKCAGGSCAPFFAKRGIRRIAIYGIEEFGGLLARDLMGSDVQIRFFIEKGWRARQGIYGKIPVVELEQALQREAVDAVVVAPVFEFNKIADELTGLGFPLEKLLSLTDVVFGGGVT